MPSSCRISSFIPRGLIVESETFLNAEIVLTVRAEAGFAVCPLCLAPSRRIHSRYLRHVSDGDVPFSVEIRGTCAAV